MPNLKEKNLFILNYFRNLKSDLRLVSGYDENPEIARRFFQGFFDAIEFIKENPVQAAEYLIVLTGLDLETQIETLEAITWYSLEDQYTFMVEPGTFVEGLNLLSAFMIEHGIEDREVNVEEWVNVEALPLD